jgi:hypothetical protein
MIKARKQAQNDPWNADFAIKIEYKIVNTRHMVWA